jgi:hypothetical protein
MSNDRVESGDTALARLKRLTQHQRDPLDRVVVFSCDTIGDRETEGDSIKLSVIHYRPSLIVWASNTITYLARHRSMLFLVVWGVDVLTTERKLPQVCISTSDNVRRQTKGIDFGTKVSHSFDGKAE